MNIRYRLPVALASLCLALAARATTYTITDLGQLPQGNAGTFAYALNDDGQVAGISGNPFLWDDGALRDLNPSLPATVLAPARAQDVNATGIVVGWYTTTTNTVHPFRWASGAFTDLNPVAATPERAIAVNAKGEILVEAAASYLVRADRTRANLAGFAPGTLLYPAGLNDAGLVAGFALAEDKTNQAALWQNGVSRPLGVLPGDVNSAATAVNGSGAIVGISYGPAANASNVRPWILRGAEMTALPPRSIFESCVAVAVNDREQVVGFVGMDTRGGEKAALLWENGQVVDLQTVLPSGSGWALRAARDINNAGQITGYGVRSGEYRAFLLTPVAPPPVPGDANGDGVVTPEDAGLIMEMASGLRSLPAPTLADVAPSPSADPRGYGDGRVDALDAVRILRRANGLDTAWP